MITYKEFEIINTMLKAKEEILNLPEYVYKNVHYYCFKNVEEVAQLVESLNSKNYIEGNTVTKLGIQEIESLRVRNAVILAAGGDEISAKSVYNMPKGLFMKDGETLIEREIRQLKEAGIDDITVVIGYKQELFFFLVDKWGVNLEINTDLKKNSIYSLYMAKNQLGSTYILNSDNYFEENPFSQYEFNSYHATVYRENAKNELVVKKNESGRILDLVSCTDSGECIDGHAYLDAEVCRRLVRFMDQEIGDFRRSALFWEEFVALHADDLDIYVREYSKDFLFEFDNIQEIQNIDGLFLGNVSGWINEKICSVLNCTEDEISDISVLEKGLSNILFTFVVRGVKYIFRYPGDSTQFFIYRKNECVANRLAAQAHADDTFIYIDEQGAKISVFRENCIDLHGKYYYDVELMKRVAQKIRAFHEAGYDMEDWEEYNYDPVWQTERLFKEASKMKGDLFKIFEKEWIKIRKLQKYADMDGVKHTMCHNDINIDNVLMTETTLDIIDYEFAGYNDPGYDFGRVIAGFEYEADEPKILDILEAYFGRPATEMEHRHWMAYSTIHNWYYVGWALYKESINEYTRDWMLFFFKQVHKLLDWCLPRYEAVYGPMEDPQAAPADWKK
ncbi:MAG: phosphotransferase [Lachnospiraceae bacterium]|nr:phosphotransferase [Lachnospiraceae bacterium]